MRVRGEAEPERKGRGERERAEREVEGIRRASMWLDGECAMAMVGAGSGVCGVVEDGGWRAG